MAEKFKPTRCAKAVVLALLASSLAFTFGCATGQKNTDENKSLKPEVITSDLYVERRGKTFKLKGDLTVGPRSSVRMDLLTTLDLPLASVVLTKDVASYILYRKKRFYTGKPNPRALDPLFPIAVNAKTLNRLVRGLPNPGDVCKDLEDGAKQCTNKAGKRPYVVTWSKFSSKRPWSGRAKRVVLELPKSRVKVKFYFRKLRPAEDNIASLMHLKPPAGFKTFSVPQSR